MAPEDPLRLTSWLGGIILSTLASTSGHLLLLLIVKTSTILLSVYSPTIMEQGELILIFIVIYGKC